MVSLIVVPPQNLFVDLFAKGKTVRYVLDVSSAMEMLDLK